jgi:hypothetical protein
MHNPGVEKEEPKVDTSLGLKTKLRMEIVIPLLTAVASFTLIYAKLVAMENIQRKAWTIQHQIMWENQLAINNPTLKVPTADGIVNLMNQQAQP